MNTPETMFYAGYGANRDPKMIEEITGQSPKIIGQIAIQDVELCVQRADQVPDEISGTEPAPISPRKIISGAWGEQSTFETYTIRPKIGSTVMGTLFELTTQQRDLIAEWELIEFGWFERMNVQVELVDGSILSAETEGLRQDQPIDRVIDQAHYKLYLANPDDMYRIAEKARLDYLKDKET